MKKFTSEEMQILLAYVHHTTGSKYIKVLNAILVQKSTGWQNIGTKGQIFMEAMNWLRGLSAEQKAEVQQKWPYIKEKKKKEKPEDFTNEIKTLLSKDDVNTVLSF